STLKLRVQQESLNRASSQILAHQKQLELMDKEKSLQQMLIEKNQSDLAAQKTEAKRQLDLLSKEGEIREIKLKKQTALKNYLLLGLLLLGLGSFFAYRYYLTNQMLKLQMLRNKIASDLHDDVGSTLSSISIFSEMAKEQSKENIPFLDAIGESSRKMLDAMADIVWTINPDNDQFEKILLKMRGFAYELLGAKKISFKFTADPHISGLKLPMDVRKNLYLIFKEAANNMAKYSGADKAFFAIKEEDGHVTMLIRDDGKGFDLQQSTQGNGIRNMQKRASEIGGQFMIDSSPGNGTLIQLRIPV
ncbi:MAG TPA: ATP-binding protein, partial [Saprospiraceae bacterium]|nr:ATP-binding protein [Saprospiraceae bacterium]